MTGSGSISSPLSPARDWFRVVVMASAAVHGAAIFLALVLRPPAPLDLEQRPIMARLVRLGSERPERLLPRKDETPPAGGEPSPLPVPAPEAGVAPRPRTDLRPEPRPRGPAPDPVASALARIRREQALSRPTAGDPDGDPAGDAAQAEAGDRYTALCRRALEQVYRLPATISERDRVRLRASLRLYLEGDGSLSRWAFESRSGEAAFDDALARAVRQARFPPPPVEFRREVREAGLLVRFSI